MSDLESYLHQKGANIPRVPLSKLAALDHAYDM